MSPVRRQAPRGQQPEPPLAQTQPLSLRPLQLALASFPLPLLPLPPFPFTVARGIFFFFNRKLKKNCTESNSLFVVSGWFCEI